MRLARPKRLPLGHQRPPGFDCTYAGASQAGCARNNRKMQRGQECPRHLVPAPTCRERGLGEVWTSPSGFGQSPTCLRLGGEGFLEAGDKDMVGGEGLEPPTSWV